MELVIYNICFFTYNEISKNKTDPKGGIRYG